MYGFYWATLYVVMQCGFDCLVAVFRERRLRVAPLHDELKSTTLVAYIVVAHAFKMEKFQSLTSLPGNLSRVATPVTHSPKHCWL